MAKEKKQIEKSKSERKAEDSKTKVLVGARGRTFEGTVTKKFPKRVVIEFQRTVFVQKYERFYRKKTRIHARLPDTMVDQINVGDYIKVQECRPLSKIIHHIVISKIRSAEVNGQQIKQEPKQEGKK